MYLMIDNHNLTFMDFNLWMEINKKVYIIDFHHFSLVFNVLEAYLLFSIVIYLHLFTSIYFTFRYFWYENKTIEKQWKTMTNKMPGLNTIEPFNALWSIFCQTRLSYTSSLVTISPSKNGCQIRSLEWPIMKTVIDKLCPLLKAVIHQNTGGL